MAQLGAETEALESLADSFTRAGNQVRSVGLRLRRSVASTDWTGPDARRFTQSFDRRELSGLSVVAAMLHARGTELRAQADQQRDASMPDSGPPVGSSAGSGTRWPNGPSGVAQTPPTPTPANGADPVVVVAPPHAEDRYLGGVELSLGFFTGGLSGDLALQQLADDRTRIVLTRNVAGGAAAGIGASAGLSIGDDDSTAPAQSGGRAAVSATVGAVVRQIWEVDDTAVSATLARVAADQALDAAPAAAGPVGTALGLVRSGIEQLSGPVSVAPDPVTVERLAQVSVSAAAAAGLPAAFGVGGGGRFDGTLRIGTSQPGTGRAERSGPSAERIVVEATSGVAASLHAALLGRAGFDAPGEVTSNTSLRLVATLDGDGVPTRVDVTATGRSGDRIDEVRAAVSLSDPTARGAAESVKSALDHLRDGRVVQAAAALGALRLDLDQVAVRTDSATIEGTTLRGGQSVGVGAMAGLGARGQHIHVDRAAPSIGR